MDGAQASRSYTDHIANAKLCGVGVRAGTVEGYPVKGAEGASSADLGCSSEYTSETLVGRSGKWFPVNSIWTGVSRS